MKGYRKIRLIITANNAVAEPPLGSTLGQYGLKANEVVKELNRLTEDYYKGMPVKVIIWLKADKSYVIEVQNVCISELLMLIIGDSGYITKEELYNSARLACLRLNTKIEAKYKSLYSTVVSMKKDVV